MGWGGEMACCGIMLSLRDTPCPISQPPGNPVTFLFRFKGRSPGLSSLIVAVSLLWQTLAVAGETPAALEDPVAAGLQGMIREATHPRLRWASILDVQPALEQLYQGLGYRPLWVDQGRPTVQATRLMEVLGHARENGLNNEDYDSEALKQWSAELASGPAPAKIVSFDLGLSVAVMRYASNLYVGRVNPRHVNFGLDIEPKKLDLPLLLTELMRSDAPAERLQALEPKLKFYEHLKTALARYTELATNNSSEVLDLPNKFSPGGHHPQVPKLRSLLVALGDLAAGAESHHPEIYDKTLEEGVKSFQERHGLQSDGVIGKNTLVQLNVPLSQRVQQIQLALERLRWLPEHIDGRHIVVNIPSFELFGFNDGSAKPDLVMNVIVGEAINERNTPVFHADMTYMIFRPYWNVPYKITAKEYVPLILRNPGYLGRNNLEMVSNFSPNSAVYEPNYDNVQLLSTGALKLRQKPGPKNALGLVKFAFPNNNNVYLHSTPSQGLFKRARRDFSHGCIRVEHPVQLGEFVLKDQGGEWDAEKIKTAMNGDKQKTVTLKTAIPVYIFYSTVLADEAGKVEFFNDLYGHDVILQDQLAKGFPYPP